MSDAQRIGNFRLEKVLSRTAYGSFVYLASDDHGHVAIEVLNDHMPPVEAERFIINSRCLSKLNHPNLLRFIDCGRTEDGRYYTVSEFIQGITLRERVRKETIAFDESARLLAIVAQTLHYLHEQCLLHRNLHLGSILLEVHTGKPYVTDLGLPNCWDDGAVIGNPSHLSPEVVRGDYPLVDGRSDVYSVGIMLYELLAGQRPFRVGEGDLINQILSAKPSPPRDLNGDIPVELNRICLKALAKRASDRYSTAEDLANDLVN
ncbi:MAG: serine/threonine-protein kinase, partial [Schlesneria sp.]